MKRRHSRFLFWGAVTLAVPPAYVSSFMAEGGPPLAEGCSGGGPGPVDPVLSSVWLPPGPIPVGLDGFFVFNVNGYSVTAEEIPDDIELEVRNGAGELVFGEIEHFVERIGSPSVQSTFTFGWHAAELLEAGQTLDVRLSARDSDPLLSSETTFTVTDATAEFAQPPLAFQEWTGQTVDVGQAVTCPNGAMTSCMTDPIHSFGADLERSVSVRLEAAAVPDPAIMTLWQYEVSAVPGKGTLREPVPHRVRFSHAQSVPGLAFFPGFADVLDEYCLRVTVRDLRTDGSLSQDWCSRPPSPMPEVRYDRITTCASVTPEYLPRWCAGRDPGFSAGGSASCTAIGGGGAGGSAGGGVAGTDAVPAGTGGMTAAGSGGDAPGGGGRDDASPGGGSTNTAPVGGSTHAAPSAGTSSEAGSAATGGDTADDAEPTTVITESGCGCRVAPHGTQREAWFSLIALAAFGSVWGRRRARR